jgi:hypothetical protein
MEGLVPLLLCPSPSSSRLLLPLLFLSVPDLILPFLLHDFSEKLVDEFIICRV